MKVSVVLAVLMALALLLTSCAPAAQPSPTPSAVPPAPPPAPAAPAATSTPIPTPAVRVPVVPTPTPATQANQPKPGGVLDVRLYLEPPGFDLQQQQLLATRMAAVPAYDGLLEYNPLQQDQIIPDLAERWETSTDGTTVTFFLRKDVKFHDGTPLTADDVVFSLERLVRPPRGVVSPNKELLGAIDKIEAVDKNTVRIRLKFVDAVFFDGLALSHHAVYSKAAVQAKGDMKNTVMGTGPFRFVRYEPGVVLEFERNKDYFRAGRPFLDGLRFFVIKAPSTGFAAFRTGKVKLTSQGSGGLSVSEAETTKKQLAGKAQAVVYHSFSTNVTHFNVSRKPWDDVRVRRAFHLAADRQELVELAGEGLPAVGGFMRPGGPWSIPDQELLKMPAYRPDKTQ
ncbi:MAG: ABC transporter substrate-binding protein, partial [Chloroflexota bacterium]